MPKNAFSALALTDSSGDEATQATPVVTAQVKTARKTRGTRVAITRPAPAPTTPDRRPPPASTNAPRRPVYRRNAKGQLVNATTGEVLKVGSRPPPQSALPPKMDAFPALGKSSGSTPAIRMGAWGAGIKAVVAAKDIPDPEIARRKAAEERRAWLKRQQAANMTAVSYYDSEDEYGEPPVYDEDPTDAELEAMRQNEEHERYMKWEQAHGTHLELETAEPEFTAAEQAAIAQYEQDQQQDDWW